MKTRISILAVLGFVFLFSIPGLAENACDCPTLTCNPCENQTGVTFYSEKCDSGKKVRSCKRPTCVLKDPVPKGCENLVKTAPAESPAQASTGSDKDSAKTAVVRQVVGAIVVAAGPIWIVRESGDKNPGKIGVKIHEMDVIETGDDAKLKIAFNDGNFVNVVPNSRLQIEVYKNDPKSNTKKTLMNLMYGKVRSMVNQKYEGSAQSSFEIRTPTAVAGVRGTDFVTSYYKSAHTTKIETIEGAVELNNPKKTKKVTIPAGNYASFIVESSGLFSDRDIKDFVDRGHFTTVEKIPDSHLAKLVAETDFQPLDEKLLAAASSDTKAAICNQPEGTFNQCAWTCLNNPSGAEKCRTDLTEVKCVRRRCNANGLWAEETRLPAAENVQCDGRKTVVKSCDY